MATHPLKRETTPRHSNISPRDGSPAFEVSASNTPSTSRRYDSLSNDNDHYSNDYSDELSGGYGEGYDEYDDLNSEAQEYYNSGASELVTTVR